MTAQQLLDSVRLLEGIAKRRKEEFGQIDEAMTDVRATQYDRVVVQGSTPDTGTQWDRLIEASKKYNQAFKCANERRKLVNEILDNMDNPLYADVLYYKYMCTKEPTWEELGVAFDYTASGIFYVHNRAVKHFSETSKELKELNEFERIE